MEREKQNFRIQQWVAVVSVLLLAVKFYAYYSTHSVSILTDALESIVNVAAGFIGLYSLYIASIPRDLNHPYGHGKAEFISAAIEGTLITSAGAIIIYKAIRNLMNPPEIEQVDMGILLVASTAVINFLLGYFTIRKGKRNDSLALLASGKHLQSDSYSTLGIIVGLLVLFITGKQWVDGAVAILFGIIIGVTGYRILRRSVAGIMDEADKALLEKMVQILNNHRRENWVDLHNLRVIKYGAILHVDCHLTVPWYLNVNEAHVEIDALASLIRKEFGESLELFVHSDGCLYFQCPICFKTDCPVRQHAYRERIEWSVDIILQNKKHNASEI